MCHDPRPTVVEKPYSVVVICKFCIILCSHFYIHRYTYNWQLMKSVGNCCNLALLFLMVTMVQHFTCHSHKVMTVPILVLPSNCYCGDFLVIL